MARRVSGQGTIDLTARLAGIDLATPLVAASGTVGSIVEFLDVCDLGLYGAAVAKSVSGEPWEGRPPPRLAPVGIGMLNGIGIQNPGIDAWVDEFGARIGAIPTRPWGSAVGNGVDEFVRVAAGLERAGMEAVEVNLSCPNLAGHLWALDARLSAEVVSVVAAAVDVPVSAKLSPNAEDVVSVAAACLEAGASWLVVGNTAWGSGIDVATRRPLLSGTIGGYSGPPLKPISLRCVLEIRRSIPDAPIVGVGGVTTGDDVVEYTLAGASAVGLGTIHFAEPRAAGRILRETRRRLDRLGVASLSELVGGVEWW